MTVADTNASYLTSSTIDDNPRLLNQTLQEYHVNRTGKIIS